MKIKDKIWIPNEQISVVGKNVKRIRIKKNLTQKQLAAKLCVSRSYICQLQYGIKMSMQMVERIAEALEVSVDELLQD